MTGTLAIIQARMSSSRLPGKVLLDICGKSMLERVLDRVSLAKQIDHILVATTIDLSDDSLLEWCERQGVDCFRGSMLDVLDRFYQAALLHKPQLISRITAGGEPGCGGGAGEFLWMEPARKPQPG